jgi:hypothetical protein
MLIARSKPWQNHVFTKVAEAFTIRVFEGITVDDGVFTPFLEHDTKINSFN